MMRYVSVIFTPEPGQWGLRDDRLTDDGTEEVRR